MSLFQCSECGCVENTALCCYHYIKSGMWEELVGTLPCSACTPATFSDGTPNDKGGRWHNEFERVYLPKCEFITNRQGNLEHKLSGSTDYMQYRL